MENNLREELIRFCDSIRNYEHESGHSIYNDERESSEFVDTYLSQQLAVTEQHDMLQEGDWFIGTEEQYRRVLEMEAPSADHTKENIDEYCSCMLRDGYCVFDGIDLMWGSVICRKTQLSPEEFIRRAENNFKVK